MPCSRRFAVLAASVLPWPGTALAHSPIEGLGDFYNGMLHPVLVPAHLVALIAAGLLIGRQAREHYQIGAAGFLAATTAGLLLAAFDPPFRIDSLLLAWIAGSGLLLALTSRLPAWIPAAAGALLGLGIGVDSGQAMDDIGSRLAALTGSGVSVYLLFLYTLASADSLRKRHWQQVAVRVVGSWIAAGSLLALTLDVLGPGST
jgi:hydrogenase/urease accessory protein HupE